MKRVAVFVWQQWSKRDSPPTMTWTGPLNSGAEDGEPPRVRTSPVVKGCLVDSEYWRIAGSKKPGSRKVFSLLVAFAQVRYPAGRCPNLLGWLLRANLLAQASKVAPM